MQYQIDQSGKIEETNKNTVLALANSKSFSILITAKCKRQLQDVFRRRGQNRIFVYWTFAAGIALLLKDQLKAVKVYAKPNLKRPECLSSALSRMGRHPKVLWFKV